MRALLLVPIIALTGLGITSSSAFAATTPAPTTSVVVATKTAAANIAAAVKPATGTAASATLKPSAAPSSAGTKVNINTATKAELLKVPGVGKKMAKEIMEYRPYKNFTKLEQKLTKYFPLNTVKKVESNFAI